ncbi:MAG TPA: FadR family transcriptional regulator [Candidatus Blautia gallistercoris]|uniref:FadR family transcriptional regulator n=1 Tax=Candidatus Blautia gallistercoris TaxID=2838490 RepID=A0A9D1WGF8_9FIRM|nr:FadR family transcriptional regulator [Candidatus Blautia gallistercoris]
MKLERVNVTNQVIAYLKKNIEEGAWKVGEKIPSENQLTKELGVSRASVRTAIQHLTGIGVLESVHGKGTYLLDADAESWQSREDMITAKDCEDIEKVLEFRQIVEPEACYLAVLRSRQELIPILEEHLEEMKRNQGNKRRFVSADMEYHKAICKASGNSLLAKTMTRVFKETVRYHEQMNDIFGYREGIRYHTSLLAAIRANDAVLAKELMYEHLQNGKDQLRKN